MNYLLRTDYGPDRAQGRYISPQLEAYTNGSREKTCSSFYMPRGAVHLVCLMIEWMTAELKRYAPQIQAIHSWNNDSGSGLCWLTALYPRPNGATTCHSRDPGLRVHGLIEAINRGASNGGGTVLIRLAGNFPEEDRKRIEPALPPNATFRASDNSVLSLSTRLSEAYPVRGLIDVLAVLEVLEKLPDPQV